MLDFDSLVGVLFAWIFEIPTKVPIFPDFVGNLQMLLNLYAFI